MFVQREKKLQDQVHKLDKEIEIMKTERIAMSKGIQYVVLRNNIHIS